MEKAVAQRLGEEAAHQGQRDLLGIVTRPRARPRGSRIGDAVDPFAGQHPRRGAAPVDMRHAEIARRRGCARKARTPPPLPCADPVPAPPMPPGSPPARCRRSRRASAEKRSASARRTGPSASRSRREQVLDAGPQHLHRHVARRRRWSAAMHLGDGGGRHRRAECGEQALHRPAQAVGDHRARLRIGKGGSRSCRCSSARGDVGADDIGPGRQHLAQLDIGGAELSSACASRSPGGPTSRARPMPKIRRARRALKGSRARYSPAAAHRSAPAVARISIGATGWRYRSSDPPGRMHGRDAAGQVAHLDLRQARPPRSCARTSPAAESGGCFRRDSDRTPHPAPPSSPNLRQQLEGIGVVERVQPRHIRLARIPGRETARPASAPAAPRPAPRRYG